MAKKNKKEPGFWKEVRKTLISGPDLTYNWKPSQRSDDNVYNDEIWGTEWDRDRLAAKERHDERRDYHDSMQEAQDRRIARETGGIDREIPEPPDGNPFKWPLYRGTGRKYHINEDGLAKPCLAKPGNCPFGNTSDHFSIDSIALSGDRSAGMAPLSPQLVADWIKQKKEKDYFDKPINVEFDHEKIADPNHVKKELENYENGIEVSITFPRNDYLKSETIVERKVGNTFDNRWKDHAYWTLGSSNKIFIGVEYHDHLTDKIIEDFAKKVYNKQNYKYNENPSLVEVDKDKEKFITQLKDFIVMTETQAAQIPEDSFRHTVVPLEFKETFKIVPTDDGNNEFSGYLSYSNGRNSANTINVPMHSPEKVIAWHDTAGKEFTNHEELYRKNIKLGRGFEAHDKGFAQGAASIETTKIGDGLWLTQIRGTRGETEELVTTDSDRLNDFVMTEYKKRTKPQTAKTRNGMYSEIEKVDVDHEINERAKFFKGILDEDHKRNKYVKEAAEASQAAKEKFMHRKMMNEKKSSGSDLERLLDDF